MFLQVLLIAFCSLSLLGAGNSPIIDQSFIEDFWLMPGHSRSFVHAIDRTKTVWGKENLFATISQPTTDTQILQQRQEIIKACCQNVAMIEQLPTLLATMERQIPIVEQYLHTEKAKHHALASACYFRGKRLGRFNNNSVALNSSIGLHYMILGLPLVAHGLEHWILEKAFGHKCASVQKEEKNENMLLKPLTAILRNKLVRNSVHLGMHIPQFLAMWRLMKDTAVSIDVLSEDVRAIAYFVVQAMHIGKILASQSRLNKVSEFYPLTTLTTASWHGLVGKLIRLHHKSPWQVTTWGEILALHKEIQRHQSELRELVQALGTIDMYTSCAGLIQHQSGWSFAQYVVSPTPIVQFDDLKHPQLMTAKHQHCCVGHDLNLGVPKHCHAIITGANAAGKSTFMTSVMIAALLAQSIGIVPAHQWTMTPFHKLISYIKVESDINAGKSLFQVELARTGRIIEQLHELASDTMRNHHALLGIDEAFFQSTQASTGTKLATNFLQELAVNPRVISVTVTHNRALTALESLMPTSFINLVARCQHAADGHKTYIVDRGTFDVNADPLENIHSVKAAV